MLSVAHAKLACGVSQVMEVDVDMLTCQVTESLTHAACIRVTHLLLTSHNPQTIHVHCVMQVMEVNMDMRTRQVT